MAGKPSRPKSRKPSGAQRTTVRKAPPRKGTVRRVAPRPSQRTGAEPGALAEHKREITALVLFGIALFLVVALYAREASGAAGLGVRTGLVFVFGRLALLVPLTLTAVAVTMVLRKRFWGTYRFAGVLVFVFGLFLLVAAGAPPFASHAVETFVRAGFETRGGILGEALYAGLHSGIGTVGVAIVGWLAGLAGVILATGITGVWVAARTRRVADAVKRSADRSVTGVQGQECVPGFGEGDVLRGSPWSASGGWGTERGTGERPPVHLGPVDLVQQAAAASEGAVPADKSRGVFGDAFEDWALPRAETDSGRDRSGGGPAEPIRGVLDGAEVFADIYHPGGGATVGEGRVAVVPEGARDSRVASDETAETVEVPKPQPDDLDDHAAEQETLPGLGRQPRQIELAVEEPAYLLPEAAVLRKSAAISVGKGSDERDVAAVLIEALAQFGVEARIIGMVVGPRVTRYELQLAPGTKVGKVSALRDDLAYALASTEIRILAPIPGKSAVGVEVPNQRPDFVTLGDIYREFPKSAGPLMVWLGKDISGKAVYADLTKLPHLLIAGTTGSGKSGCVNCLVSSVLLRSTPEQVRMIMIDPKKVELSHYDRIPHLLVPVVTNMKEAAGVLHNVVKEMESRYELLELDHARSLLEANKSRARRGEAQLPYILIVIDELADLMMSSPQEVEDYVIRLAQKSRAVGIHLVVATQRPSADVITGMIKANIPSRIAFAVSSQTDSRVILDVNGAETLLGMGDMLFKPLGSSHLQRVQGAYITETEIAALVNHWRHQAEPEFREELLRRPPDPKKSEEGSFDPDSDDLLVDAAELVGQTGSASVSMLQRRLRVGYTRAGRLIDMLERRGIVGPWEGSKPRQILISKDELESILAGLRLESAGGDTSPAD
jgi:S-DNA-T family DNA segregation ATPase FtsK/SpoIIIE